MKEMEQKELIGRRMQQARLMKKMSLDDLCKALGKEVTKQSLSNYENGEVTQPIYILGRIARVLGVTMDYFSRPYTFDINEVKIEFRKKQKISEKEIKALKMQIQDDIEKYLSVEQLLDNGDKAVRLGVLSKEICDRNDVESVANDLREDLCIGESAIPSVFALLGQLGIKVITTDGPEDFDGVCAVINGNSYVIVLNKKLDEHVERRRFTAMHELGHLLMGERMSANLKPSEVEKLCHAFASEMLMPKNALKRILASKPDMNVTDLKEIQKMYGISADAIMKKMFDMCVISDKEYKTFNIKKNMSAKFKELIERSVYEEPIPNKLQEMAYQAVRLRLMTPGKAAEILNKKEEQVKEETEEIIKLKKWEMN